MFDCAASDGVSSQEYGTILSRRLGGTFKPRTMLHAVLHRIPAGDHSLGYISVQNTTHLNIKPGRWFVPSLAKPAISKIRRDRLVVKGVPEEGICYASGSSLSALFPELKEELSSGNHMLLSLAAMKTALSGNVKFKRVDLNVVVQTLASADCVVSRRFRFF